MAILALTVLSPTEAPATVAMEAATWEEMTVELASIIYSLPELVIVDTMRKWLQHDGTETFTMEILCTCGGVCGLTKEVKYIP